MVEDVTVLRAAPATHRPPVARRVCVAIPTFRRPAALETLLRGLALQSVPVGYAIDVLVIDNDTQPSVAHIVDALADGFPFALTYVHLAEPGLCSVRNFALSYARGGFDFLAMIDDDEFPEPAWLCELLRVQDAVGADAVIGPVPQILPASAPRWLRRGRFHELPSYPDGASIAFGYSGNCLLRMKSLAALDVTFDAALNFAGGEDMLFFRTLVARGAKLTYAARAVATERLGPERLRVSYLLALNFRRGNTLAICDRRLHGNVRGLGLRALKALGRLGLGVASVVPRAVLCGRAGIVRSCCDLAHGLGALYGLAGGTFLAYGRGDGCRE